MKESNNITKKIIDSEKGLRLKEFYERKNYTQEGFAKKISASQPYISAVVSGKRNLGNNILNRIKATFPDFDEYWFTTGETEEELATRLGGKSMDTNYKVPPKDSVTQVSHDGYMEVEFRDLSVAAGPLSMVDERVPKKTLLVPREYDNGEYLVVRVEGPSMEDGSIYSIPNGANILIKRYYLENGDKLPIRDNLFVIDAKDGQALKQIVEHNTEEGYIICHSYNPEFQDYKVRLEDVFGFYVFRKIVGFRPPVRGI